MGGQNPAMPSETTNEPRKAWSNRRIELARTRAHMLVSMYVHWGDGTLFTEGHCGVISITAEKKQDRITYLGLLLPAMLPYSSLLKES